MSSEGCCKDCCCCTQLVKPSIHSKMAHHASTAHGRALVCTIYDSCLCRQASYNFEFNTGPRTRFGLGCLIERCKHAAYVPNGLMSAYNCLHIQLKRKTFETLWKPHPQCLHAARPLHQDRIILQSCDRTNNMLIRSAFKGRARHCCTSIAKTKRAVAGLRNCTCPLTA